MRESREEIAKLLALVKQVAENDIAFDEHSNLVEDIGLGSLQIMEIVEQIEDSYDFSFPLNDLADVKTVADLAEAIRRLKAAHESR